MYNASKEYSFNLVRLNNDPLNGLNLHITVDKISRWN